MSTIITAGSNMPSTRGRHATNCVHRRCVIHKYHSITHQSSRICHRRCVIHKYHSITHQWSRICHRRCVIHKYHSITHQSSRICHRRCVIHKYHSITHQWSRICHRRYCKNTQKFNIFLLIMDSPGGLLSATYIFRKLSSSWFYDLIDINADLPLSRYS